MYAIIDKILINAKKKDIVTINIFWHFADIGKKL